MKKAKHSIPRKKFPLLRVAFWFSLGGILGLFFFVSFIFIYYRQVYQDRIYPGVFVDGTAFGGQRQDDVEAFFEKKNSSIGKGSITLAYGNLQESVTAEELGLGFDAKLLAEQAHSLGRSGNILSDLYFISNAYLKGVFLPPSYTMKQQLVTEKIAVFQEALEVEPINAQFSFENNRVTEFEKHQDGKKVDVAAIEERVQSYTEMVAMSQAARDLKIEIPVITVQPEITLEKANNLGIQELIGSGTSRFQGSIVNRKFNIQLAAQRLNGILVKPGETFSFTTTLGDISVFTGYKQAYVIQNGRTVLGDGGGVCQVSTTLFRALLNAGLPITERNQHAYRVSYYEQDRSPGFDAAIYSPSVDLKFTNDTKHHILIQTTFDPVQEQLTFDLYGTSDGREVLISDATIHSQSPAPEPLYQDDPELSKGTVQQVDWAAPGAKVSFTREVKKNGETVINETFTSNFRPWQAVFLVGTKEG